jgi:hypothetical protein
MQVGLQESLTANEQKGSKEQDLAEEEGEA